MQRPTVDDNFRKWVLAAPTAGEKKDSLTSTGAETSKLVALQKAPPAVAIDVPAEKKGPTMCPLTTASLISVMLMQW